MLAGDTMESRQILCRASLYSMRCKADGTFHFSSKPELQQENSSVLFIEVTVRSNHSRAISVQSAGVRYFDIEGRGECSSI